MDKPEEIQQAVFKDFIENHLNRRDRDRRDRDRDRDQVNKRIINQI